MANLPNTHGAPPGIVILKPKLHAPLPRPEYLPRPRLLESIKAGSDRKITLIDAPAGYGKTTLLSQWQQSYGGNLPFAWVSLDEQDNDPTRLWSHITEALRKVAPEEAFGADSDGGLGIDGRNLIETALPILINKLTQLPQRVVLVLDDYHCIEESNCHKVVGFFIEHIPETVHLVFSTRYDLPFPLGRLRARGEVNEIRAEQLAFSEEEAASLLKDKLHLDVDPGDLRILIDRTEGWPAGIYLAALSLGGAKDKQAFIQSFQGSNRFVVEILGEEVLASMSEEEREFMLRTSILRRMSASVCEAVTGMKNGGRLLRELEQSNLFVVPLDEQGEWYRYHNLFAGFLRYELKSRQPELEPVLHERASKWFEQAGLIEAAIHHALAAKEYGWAGLLIARHWFSYAASGQMVTLERWLDALPEDLIDRDAALSLVWAWLSALQGRPEESERFLALAEGCSYEGKLPDGSASVEAGVALVRAVFGYGGIQTMLTTARRAQELEPPEQTSPRAALVRLALGMSLYYAGEFSTARKPLEEALRLTPVGQAVLRNGALCFLSLVCSEEGRLEEAESLAREARAAVRRFRLEEIPQTSQVPLALGRALAERGRVAEARLELEGCLSLRRQFPSLSPWPTLVGLLALAPVLLAQGEQAGARALLAEARSIVERCPDAGMFPDLLERRERELHRRQRPKGTLDAELTERELAVLRLLDGERHNREVGRLLYISPNTVKAHVKSIYRKLGVSSRKEAVEQARLMELI